MALMKGDLEEVKALLAKGANATAQQEEKVSKAGDDDDMGFSVLDKLTMLNEEEQKTLEADYKELREILDPLRHAAQPRSLTSFRRRLRYLARKG